MLTSFEDMTL